MAIVRGPKLREGQSFSWTLPILCVAFVCCASSGHAENKFDHGAAGAPGANPGGAGGNGDPGMTSAGPGDPANMATAEGGTGGSGGFAPLGGFPGAGGNGGSATASATTILTSGAAHATSSATGGPGGNAGTTTTSHGSSGGNGGGASAVSFAKTASGGAAFSTSTAVGAPAGSGNQLPGGSGGAIGAVSATAISDTGPATASVRATGGVGGAGVGPLNAPGGDGPGVTLFNAASGATTGTLTLTQTAVGGDGGDTNVGGAPGTGGNAASTLSFGSGASLIGATASATGGAGGAQNGALVFNIGGSALAKVAVTATNPKASVQAKAIAASGGSLGAAARPANASAAIFGAASGMVQSTSSTSSSRGQITMLATAFVGGPAIAATSASIGSAFASSLPPITAGQAFAAGDLLPSGSPGFGSLAMSIGYGGEGEALTYTSSATFAFTDPLAGDFKLTLLSPESSGSGFSDLTFDVRINSADHSFEFKTLSDAEMFFTDNVLDFGDFVGGVKNVAFTYGLTTKTPGDGFGFDLAIGEVSAAIPEPSTWSMSLIGFGLLGLTICRKRAPGTHGKRASSQI